MCRDCNPGIDINRRGGLVQSPPAPTVNINVRQQGDCSPVHRAAHCNRHRSLSTDSEQVSTAGSAITGSTAITATPATPAALAKLLLRSNAIPIINALLPQRSGDNKL